jgi:two-component sensor histidine kinase
VKALFQQIEDARRLAEIIVDTVREPLLVLDRDLQILFASQSFCDTFKMRREDAEGTSLWVLDDHAWMIPDLKEFIADIAGGIRAVGELEVTHDFARIGKRTICLHARNAVLGANADTIVLLRFEDITTWRVNELEKQTLQRRTDELLAQKETLLEEMQHRIVNSLQIIASILMLKARGVTSEETRQHLHDAHRRVMAVAAVQRHLHTFDRRDVVEIRPYLSKLCTSLTDSMGGDKDPVTLEVEADESPIASDDAVSMGLIVTELVINALKYAFPDQKNTALIKVRYQVNGTNWKLTVSDNGVGRADGGQPPTKGGLGTSLVNALAHQLDAKVVATSTPEGVTVVITHATFVSMIPEAA